MLTQGWMDARIICGMCEYLIARGCYEFNCLGGLVVMNLEHELNCLQNVFFPTALDTFSDG